MKKGAVILISLLMVAPVVGCEPQKPSSPINKAPLTIAGATATAPDDEDRSDELYPQYLEAKKHVLPRKIFNGPSAELGPKPPNADTPVVPDTTPFLNLVANKRLKREVMGEGPFPPRFFENSQPGKFSTKNCCDYSQLAWGSQIPNIITVYNNHWGAYAGHTVNFTYDPPNYNLLMAQCSCLPGMQPLNASPHMIDGTMVQGGPVLSATLASTITPAASLT